jgi:hypothetical protein
MMPNSGSQAGPCPDFTPQRRQTPHHHPTAPDAPHAAPHGSGPKQWVNAMAGDAHAAHHPYDPQIASSNSTAAMVSPQLDAAQRGRDLPNGSLWDWVLMHT